MIGTKLSKGQGLGNQLFCYVTARCIALDRGYAFGLSGGDILQKSLRGGDGEPFLTLWMGEPAQEADFSRVYREKEERIYTGSCQHDLTHGCFVAGADPGVLQAADGTLLEGNLQAEAYFGSHREEIREWLKVREALDSHEYTRDNLCIMNLRGGEYTAEPALYLRRRYWTDAMAQMRRIRPDMEFMIVTDDVEAAHRLLPEIPAFHFTVDKDYVTVKNARYLILSNSSFACFPAFTSETVQKIIAPKYWARHNVSDGYWASEQNIYEDFSYLGRDGKLYTAEECRAELAAYREKGMPAGRSKQPSGVRKRLLCQQAKLRMAAYYAQRAVRSLRRRLGLAAGK